MTEALREIEGTWEQVAAHGPELAGKRVFLRVVETSGTEHNSTALHDDAGEIIIPTRPAPTPEQAALGIRPAAIGNGKFEDIMRWVQAQPSIPEEEFAAFEEAIAENRAMRRQLAREKTD